MGQLKPPTAVRRLLGIDSGDRVVIVIEDDDSARLRRVAHNVTSVRGMIPTAPGLVTHDFDELIDEAMTDHADALVRRMRETSR